MEEFAGRLRGGCANDASMKNRYQLAVLRYVHDPITQEFANVGVVVYSASARFLAARCTKTYSRLSAFFGTIEGDPFRSICRHLETQLNLLGEDIAQKELFCDREDFDQLLASVLPPDDSSLQFTKLSGGFALDLRRVVDQQFQRFVEAYPGTPALSRRNEDDVWRTFRTPLRDKNLAALMKPKTIWTPTFQWQFDYACQNGIWHLLQPISLDLKEPHSIEDKAAQWLGRTMSLSRSREKFRVHFLVGDPEASELHEASSHAKEILASAPEQLSEVVEERQAVDFAEAMAEELSHSH